MDIAKYIGLYLIKNKNCFVPGIGSFQIIKKPSQFDAEQNKLLPPEYTVQFTQGVGSIDDAFFSFIATNERVSIANASNKTKDYAQEVKEKLKEGEEILIPATGKLFMKEEGVISFEVDPYFKFQGKTIPNFKIAPQEIEDDNLSDIIEQTKIKEVGNEDEIVIKPPVVNWGKIIILGLIAVGVISLAGYLIYSFQNKSTTPNEGEVVSIVEDVEDENTDNNNQEAHTEAVLPKSDSLTIAINQYSSLERAVSRMKNLNNYGNQTSVFTKDSVTFYVVITMETDIDTTNTIDSLRRFFNPGGKVEIVE